MLAVVALFVGKLESVHQPIVLSSGGVSQTNLRVGGRLEDIVIIIVRSQMLVSFHLFLKPFCFSSKSLPITLIFVFFTFFLLVGIMNAMSILS